MSIKCYFLYGPTKSGKTLTARMLSEYYSICGIPFQPFLGYRKTFNLKGYRGEEVLLLDNDTYKGREFAISILVTNWYQSAPIQQTGYARNGYLHERYEHRWYPPKCIVICSNFEPTPEMQKVLDENQGIIIHYLHNAFPNVLYDIVNAFPFLKDIVQQLREDHPERLSEIETDIKLDQKQRKEKKPKKERITPTIVDYFKKYKTSK